MQKAGPANNWHYNKKLKERANELRKNMTKSEACLWKYVLKAGAMKNYGFRRQRPVLNYIADFMAKDLMLIIELDGLTHASKDTATKDEEKTNALEKVGFTVIRFTDEEVLEDLDNVRRTLETYVEEF